MTKKQIAIDAIRNVHANRHGSLEDVLEDLQELRDLVDELCDAVQADIDMRS